MSDVTHILSEVESSAPGAAEKLLPFVYDELRKLATQKLAAERPGQTLQATALVHEAYLRLIDSANGKAWNSRGHFFAAAAEAMRRILVDAARRKNREKHGGEFQRVELDEQNLIAPFPDLELLALDEALGSLAGHDAVAAELVKLRIFAGLSLEQAADALELSRTTAFRQWTYARAWLYSRLSDNPDSKAPAADVEQQSKPEVVV